MSKTAKQHETAAAEKAPETKHAPVVSAPAEVPALQTTLGGPAKEAHPAPSVGRIVHYLHDGSARAALVTGLEAAPGRVTLAVWVPGASLAWAVHADFSPDYQNGCWSWPPRVG